MIADDVLADFCAKDFDGSHMYTDGVAPQRHDQYMTKHTQAYD